MAQVHNQTSPRTPETARQCKSNLYSWGFLSKVFIVSLLSTTSLGIDLFSKLLNKNCILRQKQDIW